MFSETKALLERMDNDFRLPAPVKLRTKFGVYEFRHRIGPVCGSYSIARLAALLFGEEHTLSKFDRRLNMPRLPATSFVAMKYREKLSLEYEPQGLTPVMYFCRRPFSLFDIKRPEKEIWIQGFLETKTLQRVSGDPEDISLALSQRS
jgi:hypothetical protein